MINKQVILIPEELISKINTLHPSDIAYSLKKIKKENEEDFFKLLSQLPDDLLGDVLLELPEHIREDALQSLSAKQLVEVVEELETDDATDIIKDIEEFDVQKANDILDGLEESEQQEINWLKRYEDDVAGAFMQTELFSADINENIGSAIKRLKVLKEKNELENIHQVFIIDEDSILLATVSLEDLIIFDFTKSFKDIIEQDMLAFKPKSVKADDDIDDVVKQFEQYDLSVVAVVGYKNRLIGRITSDDILDVVEQNATEQMYQLAGIKKDLKYEDDLIQTSKTRAQWLFINLFTAILASVVIGIFDETIKEFIALAILMPIVASMGGNSGTQTLAVMVRQIALGHIDVDDSKDVIKKEVFISIFNGLTFAIFMGIIASLWFDTWMIGVVIGLSMIITLFSAGFFGAVIPLMLKKFEIDPAVGSTVILTTITDIIGFFSFLGLAKVMLVY
jgi:magnesium transporter